MLTPTVLFLSLIPGLFAAGFCPSCALKAFGAGGGNTGAGFGNQKTQDLLSWYGGDPQSYGTQLGRQIAMRIQEVYQPSIHKVNSGNSFNSFPNINNNNNFGNSNLGMNLNQNNFGNFNNNNNHGNNFGANSNSQMPPVFTNFQQNNNNHQVNPNKGKCPYCFGNNKKVKKA